MPPLRIVVPLAVPPASASRVMPLLTMKLSKTSPAPSARMTPAEIFGGGV